MVVENFPEQKYFSAVMYFCHSDATSNTEKCIDIDMVNCSLTTIDETVREVQKLSKSIVYFRG
jgi:hypothetical protein